MKEKIAYYTVWSACLVVGAIVIPPIMGVFYLSKLKDKVLGI